MKKFPILQLNVLSVFLSSDDGRALVGCVFFDQSLCTSAWTPHSQAVSMLNSHSVD